MLVTPPLGLVVSVLPFAARAVVVSGVTYYTYNNIYYRPASTGYVVVKTPEPSVTTTVGDALPEWVWVTTSELNVRHGPASDEAIIAIVSRYTELHVLGETEDWLEVEIPGEEIQGWVMRSFVRATAAQG